ncbi:MAG: EAL domain-containing protein [Acidimicrobiia bacterium]
MGESARDAPLGMGALLEVIPDLAVVVDRHGTIVDVSRAWTTAAAAHGAAPARVGLGVSYLAVCDAAAGCEGDAGAVAAAVRQVLAGTVDSTSLRYACDRPDGSTEWYDIWVHRLGDGALIIHRDVTEAVRATIAEARAQRRYQALVERSPEGICIMDADGLVRYATPGIARITGLPPDEIEGRDAFTWIHPEDAEALRTGLHEVAGRPGTAEPAIFRLRHADGTWRWVEATPTTVLDDPELAGVVVNSRDVTDRVRAEARLRAQSRLLGGIARGDALPEVLQELAAAVEADHPEVRCAFFLVDGDVLRPGVAPSMGTEWVRAAEAIPIEIGAGSCGTAAATGEVVVCDDVPTDPYWQGLEDLAAAHDVRAVWSVPVRSERTREVLGTFALYFRTSRRPEGEELSELDSWVAVAAVAIERARDHADLAYAATHDALTGLPNRALFADRCANALAASSRTGQAVTVALLDVDRFKVLNDTMGHGAGDRALIELAGRLSAVVRPGDTVARLGGDEFAMCAPGVDRAGAEDLGRRLSEASRMNVDLAAATWMLTASVGVVTVEPDDARSVEQLLGDADVAMYAAKATGPGQRTSFDHELRDRVRHRAELEAALAHAVARDELELHLQPVVHLPTGAVRRAEALLRWRRDGELVEARRFITVAEDAGLMTGIGRWVIEEGARIARQLRDALGELAPAIALNITPAQLEDLRFAETIARALRDEALPPSALTVEVTESAVVERSQAIAALATVRAMGIAVHLDDFGTGYSSLAYLQTLPLDAVKLDRRFVARLGQDETAEAVAEAVVRLAGELDLDVIAEGIESARHLVVVRRLGCRWGQGWHLGAPVPPATLLDQLQGRAAVGSG